MRTILTVLTTAAFIATAGIAGAAEITGTVKAIDHFNKITLDNGSIVKLGTGLSTRSLHKGDKVRITWYTHMKAFIYAEKLSRVGKR